MYIVTMDIKLCCFYGNISAIFCQIYYLFYCHLKAIQSIFMNFFGDMGMDIFYTRKYIAVIVVNQYSFYSNIYQYSTTFLTYCDATKRIYYGSSLTFQET